MGNKEPTKEYCYECGEKSIVAPKILIHGVVSAVCEYHEKYFKSAGWRPCIKCTHLCDRPAHVSGTGAVFLCKGCEEEHYLVCHCGRLMETATARGKTCEVCIKDTNRRNGPYFYSDSVTIGNGRSTNQKIFEPRAFGVELESITNHVRKENTQFTAVTDQSIGTGQEFVSPIMYGDDGADEIRRLCELTPPPLVNENCGLHIHLNAKDLNWWQVMQIARGYTLVQGILFDMVPKHRRENRFCTLIKTPYFLINTKEQVLGTLYAHQKMSPRQCMKDKRGSPNKRKEFLNVHAYFYHGTIEIRLHEGTFKYEDIAGWINLNQALFKYFNKVPVHERDNPFLHFKNAVAPYPGLMDYVQDRLSRFKCKVTGQLLNNPENYVRLDIEESGTTEEKEDRLAARAVDMLNKLTQFHGSVVATRKIRDDFKEILSIEIPEVIKKKEPVQPLDLGKLKYTLDLDRNIQEVPRTQTRWGRMAVTFDEAFTTQPITERIFLTQGQIRNNEED